MLFGWNGHSLTFDIMVGFEESWVKIQTDYSQKLNLKFLLQKKNKFVKSIIVNTIKIPPY